MAASWTRLLSRTLVLKDGTHLATLHDVAKVFTRTFDNSVHWPTLDYAIELLMKAAETGTEDDVEAATNEAAIVLRQRVLMR